MKRSLMPVVCEEAGESECLQHGTHFGVPRVAARADEISDGYHTFGELYDHRRALTTALTKAMMDKSWRSKAHHPQDTPIFEGYFIVGIDLGGAGTITYHYQLKDWDDFGGVMELEHAPLWDGAPPSATVDRLLEWARTWP
jgi:hypothetical protein